MAAAQSSEQIERKVTQLRTPQRAGADADPALEEITQEEEDAAPRTSKMRMVGPKTKGTRRRIGSRSLPILFIGGAVIAGGGYIGLKTVTQHGVMVPFVNDHVVSPPASISAATPASGQFAFASGPGLPSASPHSREQGATPKTSASSAVAIPGPDQQGTPHAGTPQVGDTTGHGVPAALNADSQASIILDLARQIAAVKAQNEKISADLSETKQALTTLVTQSAASFGTVNGALGEIRHRVDRIDDNLQAHPAIDPAVQPLAPAASPVAPAAAAVHRASPAVPPSQASAVSKPVSPPSVPRHPYHVLSGSPTIALIAGPDGQGRIIHPAGVEAPGDDHLAGWGAIRELRQVGESWEVVTEHGVIH
ncbi:hypothetical protein [Asaia krungthepensis]|uniref:Uncharacterized protein n=1 Tax=Asaia krungthepensis NRIC 0535 TaxID=1307925 RepID=A0ABQ0Q4N7_9PROT|nr:hypothetical protein [Asaia krungthepensis]GBQ91240.1 hypothetical protein AA0535_2246 [Asaia krungthepensis NRIC 0535]